MRDASLQFLERLVNTPSPSGHELPGQRVWLDYARPFAGATSTDAYGNCVATLNPGAGPRIMLAAHADEIAMAVNYVNAEGFIYVRRVGGVNPANVRSQRVIVHTRNGPVPGVFGNVAPHLTRGDDEKKEPKIHDLFLDIGAANREEALRLVAIGDPVTVDRQFAMMRNGLAVARAFDNRIGCWAVAETLRLLWEQPAPLAVEVCAVSNVQEEVGLLGARQVAYALHPALALVVDVTHATDYPTVDQRQHGETKLGGGPALTHGGCNHPGIVARLEAVAAAESIPIQHEAMSNSSGTDTDVIFWTRGGIPSALISLPNRYMHSPVEVVSLKDLEMIPRLMAAFVLSIKPGEAFGAAL